MSLAPGIDVFVSYRTSDAGYAAADLAAELSGLVGAERVFRDSDTLVPGRPWPDALREALDRSRVLLAVIGPGWAGAGPVGSRRIDEPGDWVREEVATALERGIPVVPVLLDGARRPAELGLPADLAGLARLHTCRVSHRSLAADLRALLGHLLVLVPELATRRIFEPEPARPTGMAPSGLLRPEFGIVPFAGRDTETADLRSWVDGAGQAVRLLTGRGGAGKTRLALHLTGIVRERGGQAGMLTEDADTAPLTAMVGPVLVVVDYAEGRAGQVAALLAAAGAGAPLRILLVARSAGRWLTRLREHRDESVAALTAGVVAAPLAPLAVDPVAEFDRAVTAFAPHVTGSRGRPRPPVRLDTGHALDVHAAALAALLDRAGPAAPTGGPVQRVLAHERRYWERSLAAHGLDPGHRDRADHTVTAATLCGADDPDTARRLLTALPAFTGAPGEVERHRRWHVETYPGPEALPPLRPDRLGEELVAATLADAPDLAAALAPQLDTAQLVRAFTVLGRAAGRHPHLGAAMTALLRADPAAALPAAVAVATSTGGGIDDDGSLVRALTELAGTDTGAELVDHLPPRSLALAGLAVTAARAALRRETRRPRPDPAELAHLTHDLAVRLDEAGDPERSLVHAGEAVALLREIGDPAELAMALDTSATALRGLGQYADALERADEGLALLPATPSTLRVTLLSTRGNLLGDLGHHDDAVTALQEATRTSRTLRADDPAPERADRLAIALQNLAIALVDVDRLDDALAAATEAVELRTELDADRPDRYRDDLVLALTTLGAVHSERREHTAAAEIADEAVTLARDVVRRHGPRHVDRLADALNNSATALRRTGDPERAVERLTEAVDLFRDLADARPAVELASLAAALHNLGNALDDLGLPSLGAHDEAVDIFRKLAGPGGYASDHDAVELADALRARAAPRLEAGAVADALADATEAVQILRRHATSRERTGRRRLAGALHELARISADPDPAREAVDLLRTLADDDPDADHDLSAALHGLAQHLDENGRHAEAVAVFAELRTRLADDPDMLAAVLHDEAYCHTALGQHDTALTLVIEAVALRRRLLDGTTATRLDLAESLNNLADTLHDLGRDHDAADQAAEAVALCAQAAPDGGPRLRRLHVVCLLTLADVSTGTARTRALRRAADLANGDDDLRALVPDR